MVFKKTKRFALLSRRNLKYAYSKISCAPCAGSMNWNKLVEYKQFKGQVLPMRGAWIETSMANALYIKIFCAPCAESMNWNAWNDCSYSWLEKCSLCGEHELKPRKSAFYSISTVLPIRGAWIETFKYKGLDISIKIFPMLGAWIETNEFKWLLIAAAMLPCGERELKPHWPMTE